MDVVTKVLYNNQINHFVVTELAQWLEKKSLDNLIELGFLG